MKAIIIERPGGPEVLKSVERPEPSYGPADVLIRVEAAGVNRPDLFQRKGNYPAPAGVVADIPGLEVAGIIAACGSRVTRWKPGDRVCALLGGGGYAGFAVARAGHCLPIPDGISYVEAAALPETVFTVWNNVFDRGKLKHNECFLVHGGSGGIGTTAIQLARLAGAVVYATAGTKEKCTFCEQLGATVCVNYGREDFAERLKACGFDVILDSIGGSYFQQNIRLLRPDGRLVVINAVTGGKVSLNLFDLMSKRLVLTGSTLRSRDAAFKTALARRVEKQVWPLLAEGRFRPVIYRHFPLEEAALAHELMERGEHTGKLVLTV